MFSLKIPQNILESYAFPSSNSSQALPHLCTLPTACAFALFKATTTTTKEWERWILADCSWARTQLAMVYDWYTQCRYIEENWFSLSQQPLIVDSFLACVWLHAHFPSTVLKLCLVWVCAALMHAHARCHRLFEHVHHMCLSPVVAGNHCSLEIIHPFCILQYSCPSPT